MATERLSMRKIREILRHKWVLGLGYRDISSSVEVSLGGVWLVVDRAKKAGLDWPAVEGLDDDALEARVHTRDLEAGVTRPIPDCARIDLERRRVGVTLELLHLEYVEQNPEGYGYSQFCEYYRRWLARHRLSMRQVSWCPVICRQDSLGRGFFVQKTPSGSAAPIDEPALLGIRSSHEKSSSLRRGDLVVARVYGISAGAGQG